MSDLSRPAPPLRRSLLVKRALSFWPGGQSLIPMPNSRLAAIDRRIDVSRLHELNFIVEERDSLVDRMVVPGPIPFSRTPDWVNCSK